MKRIDERMFYDGKFTKIIEDLSSSKNPLKRFFYRFSITQARNRIFNKLIKNSKNSLILDLGCGGGREIIKKKGKVIGVDISFNSVKNANKLYRHAVLANIKNLPFKDNTFDVVVSFDVLGHIQHNDKDQVLKEIRRVLKPNGKTIHFIETEGSCKLLKFAKRYPELYNKYFIEQDGHFGLESPSEVVKRFEKFFKILAFNGLYFNIWPPEEYVKRFDNKYKQKSVLAKILVIFGKIAKLNNVVYGICCFYLNLLQIFEPKKFNNSSLIYIYATKETIK